MHVAVMGAGAVGCYYGGMLARAGHSVTLIARPAHVEAIRARGLRLQTTRFDEHVTLQASDSASVVANADVVLFCVKSSDTESAGALMQAHLRADALVLSLQNGVDNAQRLSGVLGREVIPTVVYVGTGMVGPGHVQHFGRGELVLGDAPASASLAKTLSEADVPSTVSTNVAGALWTKLIINCAYNAASAITQLPYGRLVEQAGMWATMRQAYEECVAVAMTSGVTLDAPVWPMIEAIAQSMGGQHSSTAQDLQKGKPTEIDHLNGYIARQGERLGIATPVNTTLHSLVKALEGQPAYAQTIAA